METQTVLNVIFALAFLLLCASLVCVKQSVDAAAAPSSSPRRESIMADDGYRGDPDELTEELPPDQRAWEDDDDAPRIRRSDEYGWAADVQQETTRVEPDVLVHHDAADLTIPQFVRLANAYRSDLWSASNVIVDRSGPVPDAYSSFDASGDRIKHQWSSRMAELWSGDGYVASNRSKFSATSAAVCYRSDEPHDSRMYVVRLLRLVDGVQFYYVHFSQTLKTGYTDDRAYTALVEAINTLKRYHTDADYVIVGNFNVHGHEAVFRHHLPDRYAVCDFHKVPTNVGRGLASPDGLVVSTHVYEAVEYHTDMSDAKATNGALVLVAALFIKRPDYRKTDVGASLSDSWPLRHMIDHTAAALAEEDELMRDAVDVKGRVHYGSRSSFDPTRHRTDTVMRVTELTATNRGSRQQQQQVEAVSSNVLFRPEPPVTTGRYVGNGVVVVRTADGVPPVATRLKTDKPGRPSKRKKKGGDDDDTPTTPTTTTTTTNTSITTSTTTGPVVAAVSPYSGVMRELHDMENTQHQHP